jgi:hypothetical protein
LSRGVGAAVSDKNIDYGLMSWQRSLDKSDIYNFKKDVASQIEKRNADWSKSYLRGERMYEF